MRTAEMMLKIARDELDTLLQYREMLLDGERRSDVMVDRVKEIMGDEFNHALIALYSAANLMRIEIPTDGIIEAMNGVDFIDDGDTEDEEPEENVDDDV